MSFELLYVGIFVFKNKKEKIGKKILKLELEGLRQYFTDIKWHFFSYK